jgi:hypothetical protein
MFSQLRESFRWFGTRHRGGVKPFAGQFSLRRKGEDLSHVDQVVPETVRAVTPMSSDSGLPCAVGGEGFAPPPCLDPRLLCLPCRSREKRGSSLASCSPWHADRPGFCPDDRARVHRVPLGRQQEVDRLAQAVDCSIQVVAPQDRSDQQCPRSVVQHQAEHCERGSVRHTAQPNPVGRLELGPPRFAPPDAPQFAPDLPPGPTEHGTHGATAG